MAFNLLASKANIKARRMGSGHGATGALGSSCVQVAKMLGARVIAGAGADERVALAKRRARISASIIASRISRRK